jgi:hypothetical protein
VHTVFHKAKGDHLDTVHSDKIVLKTIRRAGPFLLRPRVSKLTQKRLSGLSPLRSDGSHDSQWEASLCEQKPTQGLHSQRMLK